MKLIFLDFDGVVNNYPFLREVLSQGLVKGYGFKDPTDVNMIDLEKIKLLNKILDATGASIVISSSWRNTYTSDELRDFLQLKGLNKPESIIGETGSTRHSQTAKELDVPVGASVDRGVLIQHWLKQHPEVTTYVALDDDPGAGEAGTVWLKTDPEIGLTEEIVEKAAQILNSKD